MCFTNVNEAGIRYQYFMYSTNKCTDFNKNITLKKKKKKKKKYISGLLAIAQEYYTVNPVYTLNKSESCKNLTLDKVAIYEIFKNLTYINHIPVYIEHKCRSHRYLV